MARYIAVSANGCCLPNNPFGCNQKGNKENGYTICFFRIKCLLLGWSRNGLGVGVGVGILRPESESESELLKIRRLRSPGTAIL